MLIDERQGVGMVRATVQESGGLRRIELAGHFLGLWGAWQIWPQGGMPYYALLCIAWGTVAGVARLIRPVVHRVDVCLDGRLMVVMNSGQHLNGQLSPRQYVTPWLVILYWRAENGRAQLPLVMTAQGMTIDEWRRFRVVLRHPLRDGETG